MSVLKINCADQAMARELADLVLDFARRHSLGVEHHWLKGRLSLHRGPRLEPAALPESVPHCKVIAFPLARARRP